MKNFSVVIWLLCASAYSQSLELSPGVLNDDYRLYGRAMGQKDMVAFRDKLYAVSAAGEITVINPDTRAVEHVWNIEEYGRYFVSPAICASEKFGLVIPSYGISISAYFPWIWRTQQNSSLIRFVDPETGQVTGRFNAGINAPSGCAIRKDGSLVVTSDWKDEPGYNVNGVYTDPAPIDKIAVIDGDSVNSLRVKQTWKTSKGNIPYVICLSQSDKCYAAVQYTSFRDSTYIYWGQIAVLEGDNPPRMVEMKWVPSRLTLSPDEKYLYTEGVDYGLLRSWTLQIDLGNESIQEIMSAAPPILKGVNTGDPVLYYLLFPAGDVALVNMAANKIIEWVVPMEQPIEKGVTLVVFKKEGYDLIAALREHSLVFKERASDTSLRAVTQAAPPWGQAVAPGGLFTLWGTGFSTLSAQTGLGSDGKLRTEFEGTRVMMGGNGMAERACPLVYVSPNQTNAQAPADVDGLLPGMTPDVWVEGPGGQKSERYPFPVSETAPVLFSYPDGAVIITHYAPDGSTYNSREWTPGETVTIWATGLGRVEPAVPAGHLAPLSPLSLVTGKVEVSLAGTPCQVEFAGLAPGYAGLYQINVKTPRASLAGKQRLVLRQAGIETESTVFVGPAVEQ